MPQKQRRRLKRRDAKDLRPVSEEEMRNLVRKKKADEEQANEEQSDEEQSDEEWKNIPEKTRKIFAKYVLEDRGYQIIRFLGQGAYSTVYECKNPQGEPVAAKVVMSNKDDIDGLVDLLTEVDAVADLAKMKPIDWDKYSDSFLESIALKAKGQAQTAKKRAEHYYKYINRPVNKGAYEYQNGKKYYSIYEAPIATMDAWTEFIEKKGPIDYEEVKRMLDQVLKALVFLHSHGRVHLDIKPQNILRGTKPNGKSLSQLSDMGLIDVVVGPDGTDNTANIRWKVTEWYKAPEQLDECILDPKQIYKIDIYSLGATLLQIYLSKKGEPAGNTRSQVVKLQAGTYIREEHSEIGRRLLHLLKKMTAKNPEDRPTALEIFKDPFLSKK